MAQCEESIRNLETANAENFQKDRVVPRPFFRELMYEYDYGDGWQIRITCLKKYIRRAAADLEPESSPKADANAAVYAIEGWT